MIMINAHNTLLMDNNKVDEYVFKKIKYEKVTNFARAMLEVEIQS